MKRFLSAMLICAAFCSPSLAQTNDSNIPAPSLVSSESTSQGGGLPWQQGGGNSQSQDGGYSRSQPGGGSSSSASGNGGDSSSPDILGATSDLSNTVQGTAQNINDMRNSVSSLRNGGAANAAGMGMPSFQQLSSSYGVPVQPQQFQGVNMSNLSPAQRTALMANMQQNGHGGILPGVAPQQFGRPQFANAEANGMPAQQLHLANPNAPLTPAQQRAWAMMRTHPQMAQQMRNQQLAARQAPRVAPANKFAAKGFPFPFLAPGR